jgi:hypothetical protein
VTFLQRNLNSVRHNNWGDYTFFVIKDVGSKITIKNPLNLKIESNEIELKANRYRFIIRSSHQETPCELPCLREEGRPSFRRLEEFLKAAVHTAKMQRTTPATYRLEQLRF